MPTALPAANVYWDTTPGVAGAGVTPTGTWDQSTTLNWTGDVTGAAATNDAWSTVAVDASNVAIFGAGADAVAPYTVTIDGTISGLSRILLEKDGIPNQTAQTGFDTTFAPGANSPTLDFGANPIDLELTIANNVRRDLNINSGITLRTTHPTSGLIKRSSGTLQLRGTISYNGITDGSSTATFDIYNGNANVNSLNLITKTLRFGNGNSNSQLATLVFTGGTFALDSSYNLVFNGGSIGLENNDSGTGRTLTVAAPVTLPVFATNPNKEFQVGGTSDNLNVVSGLLSQAAGAGTLSLVKVDAGRWRISNDGNTFTGNVEVRNGILEFISIANVGVPSALGQGSANLVLGSGTSINSPVLQYMGSADVSTNRTIQFRGGGAGTGTATLANNGAGAIRYLGAFLNDATDNASPASGRGLILTGSNLLNNEIAAPLIDSTATPTAPATANFLSLTKNGAGRWILSGASTYSGTTTINDGTLLINGSLSLSSSLVSVNAVSPAAGVLGGTGLIARPVTITSGGRIAPGASAGTLDIAGPLTLASGSIYSVEIGGTIAGDGPGFYDQLSMTDPASSVSLDNAATLSISLIDGFDPATAAGSILFILNRADAGTYTTSFAGAPEGGVIAFPGGMANITYVANSVGGTLTGGNDVALYNVAVPEPGSLALLAMTGTGLLMRRRRHAAK